MGIRVKRREIKICANVETMESGFAKLYVNQERGKKREKFSRFPSLRAEIYKSRTERRKLINL